MKVCIVRLCVQSWYLPTELSRECETTPTDSLLEELQIVRSERDMAVQQGKSLKQEKQVITYIVPYY